jgi:hypothetical protein
LVLGIGLDEVPNRGGAFPRLDDEQRVSLRELGEIRAAHPASDFPELRSTQGARDERLETCSSPRARPAAPALPWQAEASVAADLVPASDEIRAAAGARSAAASLRSSAAVVLARVAVALACDQAAPSARPSTRR